MRDYFLWSSAVLAALVIASAAIAAPPTLSHQGRLFDSTGSLIEGTRNLTVVLYDAPSNGNVLWSDTLTNVEFSLGYYAIELGSGVALSASTFANNEVWLELTVDSGTPLSRTKLVSVPFALQAQRATSAASADTADSVSGGVVNASELRINGTLVIDSSGDLLALSGGSLSDLSCTAGQVPTYNGGWGCGPALPTHAHPASDISTGTLAIGRLPVGPAATDVARGDHNHAVSDLTGVLGASQMPTAAVALASGSTVNNVAIATTADVSAAMAGIAPHRFLGSITVGGDANTYYPVCVQKPSETSQLMCDVRVFRGYSQAAPSTWNTATHKGGLAFWLQTNCGSAWSGQPRSTHLKWFQETYSSMVAKYTTPVEGCSATCIYLRGGGAYYSFEGNFAGIETPTAYYDPAGTRDMCSPSNPPYNPPMETPVTTPTLAPVGLN